MAAWSSKPVLWTPRAPQTPAVIPPTIKSLLQPFALAESNLIRVQAEVTSQSITPDFSAEITKLECKITLRKEEKENSTGGLLALRHATTYFLVGSSQTWKEF